MALKFAALGAKVTITDINFESVQQLGNDVWERSQIVENEIKAKGQEAKAVFCDVSNADSVKEAAKIAVETFGDVEILINNAGIVSGKKILDVDEKMIEKTLLVNTVAHGYSFFPNL